MIVDKKTKIVATVGPASSSREQIKALIEAGVNIFRLNFSHGTHEEHRERLHLIREVSAELGVFVGILQDLGGPKIRLGDFAEGGITLKADDKFILTTADVLGDNARVSLNYPELPNEVIVGSKLLLDDGKVELVVDEVIDGEIITTVVHGGKIKSRRGVNAPGAKLSIKTLTEKDKTDLRFSPDNPVDFVALSFVRSVADIVELQEELTRLGLNPKIVSKIETQEAVERIEEIIKASEAVMVARGDLAVEIPAEEVPFWQKEIISKCRKRGCPVIVATQMIESMINTPVPTRAEVSDVANAILDGTDAIMLSGETALGDYPVEAVQVMSRIASRTEREDPRGFLESGGLRERKNTSESVTSVIINLADHSDAQAIVCLTEKGDTIRKISRFRPHTPIVALTPDISTARKLSITFGVKALVVEPFNSLDEVLRRVPAILLESNLVQKESSVVLTTGTTFGVSGSTNTIMMLKI